jgi:DNA-binding transcriptional LysR family regulator
MFNIKQIQAFYWTVRLGTLQQAADRLFITQSAVTKRLQELQKFAQGPLFVPGAPRQQLTAKGQELMHACEGLIEALARMDALRDNRQASSRTLRMGITELVTVTWFSGFARQLREQQPQLALHPDVDLSANLQRKLLEGEVDLAVIPQDYVTSGMRAVHLQSIDFAWLAPPGANPAGRALSLRELLNWPVIVQGPQSGITHRCDRLFAERGLEYQRVDGSNSLFAVISLVRAGLGLSCLPRNLFAEDIDKGRLQALNVPEDPAQVHYWLAFRKADNDALYPLLVQLCSQAVASGAGFST